MKRLIMLTLAVCGLSFAHAQTFTHGLGLNVLVITVPGNNAAAAEGITYSPKYNFVESDNFSLSVGIPLTLAAGGSYNSQSTDNTLSWMVNVPLIVNFNMGAGSTPDNENRLGFFVGGGFGYQYGNYAFEYNDPYYGETTTSGSMSNYGPVGNIGMRIGVGAGSHNIEIKGMYMKGLDDSKANIFGLGAVFNF